MYQYKKLPLGENYLGTLLATCISLASTSGQVVACSIASDIETIPMKNAIK